MQNEGRAMTDILQEYLARKKQYEAARAKRERARGSVEATLARAKKEFGCESGEELEERSRELGESAEKAEGAFRKACSEYDRKWGGKSS